jgi:hypothetical protein
MDIGKFVRERLRQAAEAARQAESGNRRDDVNVVIAVNTGEPNTVTAASARQDTQIVQRRTRAEEEQE